MVCLDFSSPAYLYALPLLAALPRCWVTWRYRRFMEETISDHERAANEHRTLILALAGFSFSAAVALPAYGLTAEKDVLLPTFYVVVSFLCYLGALNAQSHKLVRWHDQVGSGLADIAIFALFMAVFVMLVSLDPPIAYLVAVITLAILVWGIDLALRVSAWTSFFRAKERNESD
jgi:hypothetical protein